MNDDQFADDMESALAMPDIDREFITETVDLLARFIPDSSVRRTDAFAAAYLADRGIPPIESDDGERNDSSAIVRSCDVRASDGQDYRLVVCGLDKNAADRAESELRHELDAVEEGS